MSSKCPVSDFVIPFVLDEPASQAEQPLIYRPWGTRTIKLRVTAQTDMPPLWVRPHGVLPEDAALGIFKAYADDSRALHVTWGGGHELGPCVKTKDRLSAVETCSPFPAGDVSYLYFNLTHTGAHLPVSATVTLRAFACAQGNGRTVEPDQARLCLPIQSPPNLPPAEEIIRLAPDALAGGWAASPGHYLPAYDSRWWPAPQVTYEASERPPLLLRIEQGELLIQWGEPAQTIAVIQDCTHPSVLLLAETLAFELFAFDPWSVALRVWFFWVDKFVGRGLFVGRHEIPDAERFDLIIRRKDGRVMLAGSDLHWREVWARVLPSKTLRATLGIPRATAIQLARHKWSDVWNRIWARADDHDIAAAANGPNNPVEPYIRRLAEREATVTIKASGTEAHLPMLHNVEQRRPPVMTSSDVRLG